MRHNEPSHLDFDAVILKLGIHTSMLEDMLAKLPQEMSMAQIQILEGKVSAIVQEIAQYKDYPTLDRAYDELIRMSDKLLQAYKGKRLGFQKAHMDQPALEIQKERKDFKEDKHTLSLDSFRKLMKTIMHEPASPLTFDNTMGKIVRYRSIFKNMPQYLPEIHTLQEVKLFKEIALAMADEISRIYKTCPINDIPKSRERERLDKAYGELKGLHDEALKTYNEKLWEPLKSHYDKYALELKKKLQDFKESKEVFTLKGLETEIKKLDNEIDQHLSAIPIHDKQISFREVTELMEEMRQNHEALKSAYEERRDQVAQFEVLIRKIESSTLEFQMMFQSLPQEIKSLKQIQSFEDAVSAIDQELSEEKNIPTTPQQKIKLNQIYNKLSSARDKVLDTCREKQLEFQKTHTDKSAEDEVSKELKELRNTLKTIGDQKYDNDYNGTAQKIIQYMKIFEAIPSHLPRINSLEDVQFFEEKTRTMSKEIKKTHEDLRAIFHGSHQISIDNLYNNLKGPHDKMRSALSEKLFELTKSHCEKYALEFQEDLKSFKQNEKFFGLHDMQREKEMLEAKHQEYLKNIPSNILLRFERLYDPIYVVQNSFKALKESHQKRHEEIEKSAASFSSSQEKVRLKAPGSSALFSGSNSSTSSSSSSSFSNR